MKFLSGLTLFLLAANSPAALIGFNAADGSSVTTTVTATLGADFDPALSDPAALGGSYITIESDGGGTTPGNANRTAQYNIFFSEAGTYHLYARLLVESPNGASNDSFFYAREFGTPDPTNDGTPIGWATMNDLYRDPEGVGTDQYAWINLSTYTATGGEDGSALTVDSAGTHEFWIGAREDGLRIDAFAFGSADQSFSDA
ncbi:MAG: hypothetical protein ACQKBY_07810 [Verrucomicrobiales bacterium]